MGEVFEFDSHELFLTALVTVLMQLFFFFIAFTFKFDKVTDFAGVTNFIVLALLTYFSTAVYNWRQTLATVFVVIWGVRLAGYLVYRILKIGKDDRFDDVRNDFFKFLGFWIFQMFWVWTVSLPVIFLNTNEAAAALDPRDVIGIMMFWAGLAVEAVGDQQKFNFKNIPENRKKFCDAGLWSWSRHPNYFGEILLWWGMFTMCSSVFKAAANNSEGNWGYATIAGPIFTTVILLFVSGIPPLEKSADERYGASQTYQTYKSNTSCLIPVPPSLFCKVPTLVKKIFFFEWYGDSNASQPQSTNIKLIVQEQQAQIQDNLKHKPEP